MSTPVPAQSSTAPHHSSTNTPPPGKPNLILILTDQVRALQWFPPGWEEKHLPAMTFLKKHGLSFGRAVCNTCACTPSRISLFTSAYPASNGSSITLTEFFQSASGNFNATPTNVPPGSNTLNPPAGPYPAAISSTEPQLDQTLPNLATILAEAGYDTFYKGKFHLGKGVLGYDNLSYDADPTRYGFKQWDPRDAGQDQQIQNYGGGDANNDTRYVNDAIAFLQDRIDNAANYPRPFCLVFSLVNPHDVLGYPMNWVDPENNGGYGPEFLQGDPDLPIHLPPTVNEDLNANFKPGCQQSWLTNMGVLTNIGDLQPPQRKAYLNFYGNLMHLVDSQIGSLLNLFNSPAGQSLWKKTSVIRTSDHGEMGMTHGGMRQKWFNAYQETIRIPLIWTGPGLPQGASSDALVTHVDLLPTIAEYCGVPNPQRFGLQGRSYAGLFANPAGQIQDYTYFLTTDVKAGQKVPQSAIAPNNIAMVRNAQFKYVRYYGGFTNTGPNTTVQEEFYNLATDVDPATGEPVELQNKSAWAQSIGAPWTVTSEEAAKRDEMASLLARAMTAGVLATQTRTAPPVLMKPRAKTVANFWGTAVVAADKVYQIVCYTQRGYRYDLQVQSNGTWVAVASTTTLIPTTLSGNNGPMLFQAQPTLQSLPAYRVARTAPDGGVDYEPVAWTDYTLA